MRELRLSMRRLPRLLPGIVSLVQTDVSRRRVVRSGVLFVRSLRKFLVNLRKKFQQSVFPIGKSRYVFRMGRAVAPAARGDPALLPRELLGLR